MLPIRKMSLMGPMLAGCLAALLPASVLAGPVGDFAPLAVGHSWAYRETDSTGSLLAVTTLRIASRSRSGNADTYRLDVTDSLLRPGDTLWERSYDIREQNGVITGITLARSSRPDSSVETLVESAFAAHTYDSGQTAIRTIDSVPRMVVEVITSGNGVNLSTHTESLRIRDVGLHTLSYTRRESSFGSFGPTKVTFYRYSLEQFNAQAFAISAATSPGKGARRLGPARKGAVKKWVELGVDPLGRVAAPAY